MLDLILAAALAQAATPAPNPCFRAPRADASPGCPTWRLVSRDDRGGRYYAPDSAVVNGGIVDVMTRTDAPTPVEGATLMLAAMRVDCARRTFTIGRLTGYDDAGVPVVNVEQVDDAPRPVQAGQAAEVLLTQLCPH